MAADDKHDGVEVEGQAAPRPRVGEQGLLQLVVQPGELPDVAGAQPAEEAAQRGLIGEAPQPHDLLEGAVVLQDLRRIDAVEAHDDGVEQRHQQIGG